MARQVVDQRLSVASAIGCRTDAVDSSLQRIIHTEASPQLATERNQLDILIRRCDPESLHSQLVKLPLATLLGPLVAKHRPHVPKPLGGKGQIVLHHRSDTPCRPSGRRRHAVIIAVGKAVHFFFNNVGDLTDRAGKKIGRFNDRQSDFSIAVARQHLEGAVSIDCHKGVSSGRMSTIPRIAR